MGCSKCNGNGLGFSSAMFADDVPEEKITMVNPIYAHLPDPEEEARAAAVNHTADLVVSSLDAQAPTANGRILYFDENAPYVPPQAPAAEPAPQAKGGAGKVAMVGLGLYLAWKLLG